MITENSLDLWLAQVHAQLKSEPHPLSTSDLNADQRAQLEEIKTEIATHLTQVIMSTQKTIHALTKKEALIQGFLQNPLQ